MWSGLSLAGRVWVAGFVTVMLAVPTLGLMSQSDSVAFGWQMYSRFDRATVYEVERDGAREPLSAADWIVTGRGVFGAHDHLPPHICTHEGSVDAVWMTTHVVTERSIHEDRYPCER